MSSLPIRAVSAALLFGLAAVPPALYLVHLGSPEGAVRAVQIAGQALRYGGLAALALTVLGLLLYPPFLPAVRLAASRARARLGTDLGPLREAQGRLRHLETAADHLVAGRVLLSQGRLQESLGHLQRAVEIDPAHAASRYQLGLALSRAGQLAAAAQELSQVVQQDPAHAFGAAMLELGVVLERGGAEPQALDVLSRHDREFGANRRNLFHRARALSRLGRRDEAKAVLRLAARPAEPDTRLPVEEDLIRARARMALLRGGHL